jgi:hypothetical protein
MVYNLKQSQYPIPMRSRNSKSIHSFIQENKSEIDSYILKQIPNAKIDDEERRLWILNDEGLYLWAKREGVKI